MEEEKIPCDGRTIDINSPTSRAIMENYDLNDAFCPFDEDIAREIFNKMDKRVQELKQENEKLDKENQELFNDKIALDQLCTELGKIIECKNGTINSLARVRDNLKAENETLKKMLDDPEVIVALTDVRTGERKLWYENCLKYKQTLQEIKEIAIGIRNATYQFGQEADQEFFNKTLGRILHKISEVE